MSSLDWARRLQAIAQSGLAYDDTPSYDRERYEQVRQIAAEMVAQPDGRNAAEIERFFAGETGHATPKLDVRGVVFRDDAVLLVQERADGRWALPGGWVDVGETPSAAVEREVLEESGYATRALKLLALQDHDRHLQASVWHLWNAVFLCELVSEEQAELHAAEILAARFFRLDELPELSPRKASERQLQRLFEHREHPEWPTDFD